MVGCLNFMAYCWRLLLGIMLNQRAMTTTAWRHSIAKEPQRLPSQVPIPTKQPASRTVNRIIVAVRCVQKKEVLPLLSQLGSRER